MITYDDLWKTHEDARKRAFEQRKQTAKLAERIGTAINDMGKLPKDRLRYARVSEDGKQKMLGHAPFGAVELGPGNTATFGIVIVVADPRIEALPGSLAFSLDFNVEHSEAGPLLTLGETSFGLVTHDVLPVVNEVMERIRAIVAGDIRVRQFGFADRGD